MEEKPIGFITETLKHLVKKGTMVRHQNKAYYYCHGENILKKYAPNPESKTVYISVPNFEINVNISPISYIFFQHIEPAGGVFDVLKIKEANDILFVDLDSNFEQLDSDIEFLVKRFYRHNNFLLMIPNIDVLFSLEALEKWLD